MVDVYVGSKPGRPTVLLGLVGVVLAGTLGLALLQVRGKTALGAEQQAIPGEPLYVRPPRGWVADPNRPGSFVLPVRRAVGGRERWEVDRSLHFGFERAVAFEPPAQLLAAVPPGNSQPEPARIGRFDAVQIRQVERRHLGRRIVSIHSIRRLAILPTGHVITVVYIPMTDLTLADLKLLDKVCATIRIDDAALDAAPEQAWERSGVEFPVEDGWQFGLPALAEAPGFFVGGSEEGFPAWSLGVFRTWLAGDRTPADLLNDFAARAWPRWSFVEGALEVQEWKRADGTAVAVLRHPNPERNRCPVASVWVVAQSPSMVVMLFVYTNASYATVADAVAQRVAAQIRINSLATLPEITAAQANGADLAARLTRKGAVPWWGRAPARFVYQGNTPHGQESLVIQRAAVQGDPDRGYQGVAQRIVRNREWEERTHWTLGRQAVSYTFDTELYISDGQRITVSERRPPGADTVQRVVTLNDAEQRTSAFRPGSSFISPPIESIAESQVARETEDAWIVEVSTLLGRGTHTRLLRPLPPENGCARVWLQDDYWLFGVIVAFDEDDELQYEQTSTVEYRRVE